MLGRLLGKSKFRGDAIKRGSVSTLTVFGVLGALLSSVQTVHADGEIDEDDISEDDPRLILRKLVADAASRYSVPTDKSISITSSPESMLRQYEGSGVIKGDTGVSRFDVASVPCGNIKCTIHALSSVRLSTGNSWTFFGLYDGRNGPYTSDYLGQHLIPTLLQSLLSVYTKYTHQYDQHVPLEYSIDEEPPSTPLSDALDEKIKETFLDIDGKIVNDTVEHVLSSPSRTEAVISLEVAQSAASALVALYDSDTRLLKVSLTGDSRAVVGRNIGQQNGRPVYYAHVLTTDQNMDNQAEVSRVQSLHPNETPVAHGRFLGRTNVFRAFGDAAFKWTRDVQERLHDGYFGDRPLPELETPPYITAEPEVTTFEVKPGDFLILGSNGLWKSLTNEEAVGLVGIWLENQSNPFREEEILRPSADVDLDDARKVRIIRREELPIRLREDDTFMYSRWRTEKKFIAVDSNVATHLARNALGGADRDLTAALLNTWTPFSHRWRNDINMIVVFFKG